MAKKTGKKAWNWANKIWTLLITLVVAGLFITKTTTSSPLLKYVPEMIHPWIGWLVVIIIVAIILIKIWKFLKKRI